MKTIAVRLDGLLVENSATLPNADPIPAAVLFVQTLSRGGAGRVFIVTSAPEEVTSDTIRDWLRRYQIPMTDLVRLSHQLDWTDEDQILSAAGARSTVLGLYVVAYPFENEVEYMAAHGIPTVAFAHADPVIDYRPQRGLTWSTLGISQEKP